MCTKICDTKINNHPIEILNAWLEPAMITKFIDSTFNSMRSTRHLFSDAVKGFVFTSMSNIKQAYTIYIYIMTK